MTPWFLVLVIAAQAVLVSGQILLKRAMMLTVRPHYARRAFAAWFLLAIACMTFYFFLWLGLMGYVPLSQLAPFDALGPVLLVAAVSLVLKERLSPRAWVGVLLILSGVTIIALS